MRPFADRSPFVIGLVGMLLCVVVAGATLNYDKLPFVTMDKQYSAYFAEAGGLKVGAPVEVAGYRIGSVKSISLDGARVLVKFAIDKDVHLGSRSEANIRTKTLLGAKLLQITTLGDGELTAPIPIERTKAPYQLPDALGDLTKTISGIDTGTVTNALATLSETFRDTPPELKEAVDGVARFAQTLDARDAQLRNLLMNASKATHVLSERTDQLVGLVGSTNALLIELRSQSVAVDNISVNLSAFARQLKAFIDENQTSLRPALDKLNGVLTLVDNRKDRIQQAVKYLNQYALSLGEVVGSGPFFKAYIVNLLPGQFIQPFIDAAFSDLGLDPNVLLPSQRTDPPTGQPATPPLPVPYPRTGQGGAPRLTLPDAITGNPGDPRYPYREPLPAPAPGGPPPGPPAPAAPGLASPSEPTPSPVYHPAPNEVPPPGAPQAPRPAGGGQ